MKLLFTLLFLTSFLTDASSQNPTLDQAHELLADGYLEEALDMFNDLESSNKSNAEFFFLRGSCLSELGENEKAIADLNISISLNNLNADAFYQRGFANFTLGNSPLALEDFNQTITLSPEYGEAYLNRGTVQYDLGNAEAACQDWQYALDVGLTLAQSLLDQLCND